MAALGVLGLSSSERPDKRSREILKNLSEGCRLEVRRLEIRGLEIQRLQIVSDDDLPETSLAALFWNKFQIRRSRYLNEIYLINLFYSKSSLSGSIKADWRL